MATILLEMVFRLQTFSESEGVHLGKLYEHSDVEAKECVWTRSVFRD